MVTPTDAQFTYEQVFAILNRAADEIIEAAQLPDSGAVDAVNLVVNVSLHYLKNPDGTLHEAVKATYPSEDPDDVLTWPTD